MIKTTLGAILKKEVDSDEDKRIYFIRDINFPIYIGQAMYVCERITDHCGLGPRVFQPDQLGDFILSNRPNSLEWQVDLLTLDECELIARLFFPSYLNFDTDTLEQALIIAFGPSLNTFHNQNNPNRKAIPEKHQKHKVLMPNKSNRFASEGKNDGVDSVRKFTRNQYVQNSFLQYRQHLSPHTIRSLLQTMDSFQRYLNEAENIKLDISNDPSAWSNITAEIINKFIQRLITQGFAISTINLRISFIKKYATIAFHTGNLSEVEWKKISDIKNYYGGRAKRINKERIEKEIPTQIGGKNSQEIINFTDLHAKSLKSFSEHNADGRRANLIMSLLLDHGLQASDIVRLRAEHFDLVLGVFSLERLNMGRQTYKMSPDTLRALRCVFDNQDIAMNGPLGFRIWKNGKTVQDPITPPSLRYYVRTAGKTIGIKNLTVQTCRSYWIKKEIESGSNILDLQSSGGWTSIQSVLRNVKKTDDIK